MKRIVGPLMMLAAMPTTGNEADDSIQALLALDLYALTKVTFTSVASKTVEAAADASASVTSYSAQEIRELGYFTLADLANITPGYHSHTFTSEVGLGTRGLRGNEFDNGKHLLVFDGIPIHHLRSNKVPTDHQMPLFIADNVQFLRGPASALYGANAFFGVIDITPKSTQESDTGDKAEGMARTAHRYSQHHFAVNLFGDSQYGNTTVSASYFDKHPSGLTTLGSTGLTSRVWDRQRSKFLFAKHQFDSGWANGLSFGMLYSRHENGYGENGIANDADEQTIWRTIIPYVKHEKDWTDNIHTSGHVRYNRSDEVGHLVIPPGGSVTGVDYAVDMNGYGAQFEVNAEIGDGINLLLGTDYDARRVKDFPDSNFYNLTTTGPVRIFTVPNITAWSRLFGLYGQVQWEADVLAGTIFTLGGRYSKGEFDESEYSNFSPRATVVQRLRDDLNVKLMYGKSFRAPNAKEVGFNREFATRNNMTAQSLSPELLESTELSVVYHRPEFTAEATVFRNTLTDSIERTPGSDYLNTDGKTTARGIELSAAYSPSDALRLKLNYSYAKSKTPDGERPGAIPTQTASLVVSHSGQISNKAYNVNLINRWVHIPAHREHPFRRNVNTDSDRT